MANSTRDKLVFLNLPFSIYFNMLLSDLIYVYADVCIRRNIGTHNYSLSVGGVIVFFCVAYEFSREVDMKRLLDFGFATASIEVLMVTHGKLRLSRYSGGSP